MKDPDNAQCEPDDCKTNRLVTIDFSIAVIIAHAASVALEDPGQLSSITTVSGKAMAQLETNKKWKCRGAYLPAFCWAVGGGGFHRSVRRVLRRVVAEIGSSHQWELRMVPVFTIQARARLEEYANHIIKPCAFAQSARCSYRI
jgi:hypothetical protein